ncbi:hypothetical protein BKA12_002268 [Neomicrococcus lactis]|uniref:Uncharacterized protein n=1 Tax=Neomicrococcus lactis TaxID=732241 RepID=A0A7W8YCT4_9MICC|nr:hypothetical protein [Neomicrococcus lactis]
MKAPAGADDPPESPTSRRYLFNSIFDLAIRHVGAEILEYLSHKPQWIYAPAPDPYRLYFWTGAFFCSKTAYSAVRAENHSRIGSSPSR